MAEQNVTPAQRAKTNAIAAQKAKAAAHAKAQPLTSNSGPLLNTSAEHRGRTSTEAARHSNTTPTPPGSTRSSRSQRTSPGHKPPTTTTAGKDTRHPRHPPTPQSSTLSEPRTESPRRSSSAEHELRPKSPPDIKVGMGKDFWAPEQKPWCKKKAALKKGLLFDL